MTRVALHYPALGSGVIHVVEDHVDRLIAAGWEPVSDTTRSGRRTRTGQTGAIPVQQPAQPGTYR